MGRSVRSCPRSYPPGHVFGSLRRPWFANADIRLGQQLKKICVVSRRLGPLFKEAHRIAKLLLTEQCSRKTYLRLRARWLQEKRRFKFIFSCFRIIRFEPDLPQQEPSGELLRVQL